MTIVHSHLVLDVDVADDDDEPLHGHVESTGVGEADFTGWLGLLGALERLLDPHHGDKSQIEIGR